MYDFIMNLNIFVLMLGLVSFLMLVTLSFAVLETFFFKAIGKDKEPFAQCVSKHFDEITEC
jgi:hypothetical protein